MDDLNPDNVLDIFLREATNNMVTHDIEAKSLTEIKNRRMAKEFLLAKFYSTGLTATNYLGSLKNQANGWGKNVT